MTTTTTIEHVLRELRASGIRVVLRDERVPVSAAQETTICPSSPRPLCRR